jgi:transcriptional regulator with XRE-family HTH domain
MNSNNLIEELLNSLSPEESLRIENRMLMAAKIDEAIKAKGWKKKDLMKALGKTNQSEVTKWLSGTHNFTLDLLTDLGRVLEVNFLNLEKPKTITEIQYKTKTVLVTVNTCTNNNSFCNDILVAKTIINDQITSVGYYESNN